MREFAAIITSWRAKIFDDILLEAFLGEASNAYRAHWQHQILNQHHRCLGGLAAEGHMGCSSPVAPLSVMAVCARVARVRASVEEKSFIIHREVCRCWANTLATPRTK